MCHKDGEWGHYYDREVEPGEFSVGRPEGAGGFQVVARMWLRCGRNKVMMVSYEHS